MKKTSLFICCAAAAFLLTGCRELETLNRVEPAKLSAFLPHQELLKRQEATFPFHYFYVRKKIGKYDNICVAPVETRYMRRNEYWAKLDQKVAAQIGSDIKNLAGFAQKTFKEAFQNASDELRLKVVDSAKGAKGKTLLVRLAIVSIVPTKAELNYLGIAADIFIFPGISAIAQEAASGTITMECVIEDAETGTIVAMFADTEKAQSTVINLAGMTWYRSAERNIESLAQATADIFSGRDYSYFQRPIVTLFEY